MCSGQELFPRPLWLREGGNQVTLMVDLHQTVGGFHFDMITNRLMGNRVAMAGMFDVVVRYNFGSFGFSI